MEKRFWDKHTEADARQHVANDPDRYQFTNTDPMTSLKTITTPGLGFWIQRHPNTCRLID
jgi:hypothetical protein